MLGLSAKVNGSFRTTIIYCMTKVLFVRRRSPLQPFVLFSLEVNGLDAIYKGRKKSGQVVKILLTIQLSGS